MPITEEQIKQMIMDIYSSMDSPKEIESYTEEEIRNLAIKLIEIKRQKNNK